MRLLLASVAPWSLHSGVWVRSFANSWGEGIAKSGYPGTGRWPVFEVNDGTGQEDPDRLIRCFANDAYEVWVERDKISFIKSDLYHRFHVTALVFKPPKRPTPAGHVEVVRFCVI
jgi:hypothetical protein